MSNNLIFEICTQKRQRQLFNNPTVRLELQESPYQPNAQGLFYTKDQLDMRRKAEILKYSANKQSTQTNSQKKNEQYSQTIGGSYQRRTYSNTILKFIADGGSCPNDDMIPTPTSSSGIPGPIMYLFNDETIPLYNYTNSIRSYAIIPAPNNPTWRVSYLPDILQPTTLDISNNISTTKTDYTVLYTIAFLEYLNKFYVFDVQTPISFFLSGTVTDLSNTDSIEIESEITSIYLTVFYSNSGIISNDPNMKVSNTAPNTFSLSPSSHFQKIKIQVSNNGNFTAAQYIGNLSINNLSMQSSLDFVYTVQLSFNLTTTLKLITTNEFNNNTVYHYTKAVNSSIYTNTSINTTQSTNCVIISTTSTDLYKGFTISGV